jgi:transcriptional regulator with XRE-family HTH domain
MGLQLRGMARRKTLEERVSERFKELAEKRGFATALAKRLGKTPSAITPYINGSTPVSIEVLEAVSELAQIPVAELVASEESSWRELDSQEAAIVRALRHWPDTVRDAFVAFVQYFADEPPAAGQTRNVHEHWRHLSQAERDEIEPLMLLLRRRVLQPEQLKQIHRRLTAAAEAVPEWSTAGLELNTRHHRKKD